MEVYLLKSTACLVLFLLFYKLVLEKESMHLFKRFYLLGVVLLSFVIPLITFTYYIEPISNTAIESGQAIVLNIEPVETSWYASINWTAILWSIYLLGVGLFAFKFFRNLFLLKSKIKDNPKTKELQFTNVLLKDLIAPHTFFNYIFFNKQKYDANEIPKEVFWHEQTHALQKHSLDVILIEILQIIFWFNPLIYLYKHLIRLNHEFLADQGVINKGINTSNYQETILAFSSNASTIELANAINYSLIKKRFTVMKTNTSRTSMYIKSFVVVPLVALMLFSFSSTETIEKETNIEAHNDIDTSSPEYHYKKQTFWVRDASGKKVAKKYHQLSEYYKRKWLLFPPNATEKVGISTSEFNRLKDASKYVIRINGNVVNNSKLNSYTPADFVAFTKRTISPLAELPQKYHYNLLDEDGFELGQILQKNFKNAQTKQASIQKGPTKEQLKEYNKLAKKFNAIKNPENIVVKQKDLERIEYLYGLMTKEQRKNNEPFPNIPVPPPFQKKATKEQIKEYNALAKKVTKAIKKSTIVKQKEISRLKYLYGLMTKEQRKNAEAFPDIPPIPQVVEIEVVPKAAKPLPPPPPPIPENATPAQRKKYETAIKNYKIKVEKAKKAALAPPPPPPPPIPENATPEQRKKYEAAVKMYKQKVEKHKKALSENRKKVKQIALQEREVVKREKERYAAERKILVEQKRAKVRELKEREATVRKLERERQRVAVREIKEQERAKVAKITLQEAEKRAKVIEVERKALKEQKAKLIEQRKAVIKLEKAALKEQKAKEKALKEKLIKEEKKKLKEKKKNDNLPKPTAN